MTDSNSPIPESPVPEPVVPPAHSNPLDYKTSSTYLGPAPDKDAITMATVAHIANIFGVLGPLIVWLLKKDSSPFVDDQGKEALNFGITIFIGYCIAGALVFVFIGLLLFPILLLANLIFAIMGAMQANKGIAYRYPFALRLIK